MKFRKKPVVIEAIQITDQTFDAPHPNPEHIPGIIYDPVQRCVFIETLEGTHRGDHGDWIITGIKGEHYPCKPDIFAATYELAEANRQTPAFTWSLDVEAVKLIRDFTESDDGDDPAEITLSVGELEDDDGVKEYGLRMHFTEYPEEGGVMLVAMEGVK